MPEMSDGERDAFIEKLRLGVLSTLREDGSPVAVPVWFEWDGRAIRIFSSGRSGKIARLKRDPRASLLVANSVGEPEAWVAFDGEMTIKTDGAFELAERLAGRYWDVTDAERRATLNLWRRIAPSLRLLELVPTRIHTSTS